MKRFLISVASVALIALPVAAQQSSSDDFVPGVSFLMNWDLDDDGKVTLDELGERRADLFAAFDENEDGNMSLGEFKALDDARVDSMQRPADRGNGNNRAEQVLEHSAIDTNSDGIVTEMEFVGAAAAWMKVMDSDADGVLSKTDFGPGARQQGAGQARQGMGQGQGQGRGQGQGKGHGQRQGMGQGQGQDTTQGQPQGQRQGMGKGQGQGQGQATTQGQGQGQGKGQGQGQGRGQGKGHGQSMNRSSAAPAPFQAFPTDDGALWIVDSTTGDILLCRATMDSSAPAGFAPICVEANR